MNQRVTGVGHRSSVIMVIYLDYDVPSEACRWDARGRENVNFEEPPQSSRMTCVSDGNRDWPFNVQFQGSFGYFFSPEAGTN